MTKSLGGNFTKDLSLKSGDKKNAPGFELTIIEESTS